MILLVLAILSSFSISILIKIYETKGSDTRIVLAANYVIASAIGWFFVFLYSSMEINISTLLFGLAGGILWPATFFLFMWGIRNFGLSIVGSIIRLSLAVPVLFALIFLKETLSIYVIAGITATFLAFYLLRKPSKKERLNRKAAWFFPVLVLCFGIADLWVNIFNNYGVKDDKFLFLVLIFTFSAVFTWTANFFQNVRIDKKSLYRGVLLGIPNFFSTFFLLEALRTSVFINNSAAAYSLYSSAGVVLAFTAGALIWREKVTGLNISGVIVGIIAIILLNMV